jgi:hypothetical protein
MTQSPESGEARAVRRAGGRSMPGRRDADEKQNACISWTDTGICGQTGRLLAQTEFFDQRSVTIGILAFHVIEQFPAPIDHPQQAAPAVVILHVRLEMAREIVDPRSQQGNLHFGRPRILGTARELRNDFGFIDICD